MIEAIGGFWEIQRQATNMSPRMTNPCQKAEKLPQTKPERMLSEKAPPWRDEVTISFTCRLCVEVKAFVNSGIQGSRERACDRDDRGKRPPEVGLACHVAAEAACSPTKVTGDRNERGDPNEIGERVLKVEILLACRRVPC